MQKISISEIPRNLHKLDNFDIIEIVDKKRHKVKGYYLNSQYASLINDLIKKKNERSELVEKLAGSLQEYADPTLIDKEDGAWQKHILNKYAT